ncbi:MAG TPA: hypothetical protein PKB13_10540, partial [Clostridia bacterium]|nr:hypothetical protein [Clostridia bacterium]
MDKLQYDSFYKFLVSAGVVFVAAPVFGLYYLLCNGNQILISQIDYDALSNTSMQFIQQRDQTILCVLKALPWILIGLIVVGLGCLIYGGIKWHNIQKELDEQTKLKTQEQKVNVQKLSASEIAEKAIEEVADEHDEQSHEATKLSIEKTRIVKAMQIEDLCFSYISRKNPRSYNVQQNVKVGNFAYDIIATSKIDNIDYLYEIKYWTSEPSMPSWVRTLKRAESAGVSYETIMHRNFRSILLIVTSDDCYEKVRTFCEKN